MIQPAVASPVPVAVGCWSPKILTTVSGDPFLSHAAAAYAPYVGAVGIPKFIKSDWIKDNAVVVDAGYHPEKCGDIDLEGVISRSSAYTPVPGGVGPMTINTLIMQTLESCEAHLGLD